MTDIIKKIEKLLNLARNNPNDQEAQAAMLKAQQLMAEHHLDMRDLESSQDQKEVVTIYHQGNQNTQWAIRLANIITKNFRCSLLRNPHRGLVFIGLREDVAIASGVYIFATQTLDRNMRKLRRQYRKAGKSTEGISGDYALGFVTGLHDKYKKQVEENNWALVLVKDALVVKETERLSNPNKLYRAKDQARSGDMELYAKGYRDGHTLGGDQKKLKGA